MAAILGPLGVILGFLGAMLSCLQATLVPSGLFLAPLWTILAPIKAALRPLRPHLGCIWGHLVPIWNLVGLPKRPFNPIPGHILLLTTYACDEKRCSLRLLDPHGPLIISALFDRILAFLEFVSAVLSSSLWIFPLALYKFRSFVLQSCCLQFVIVVIILNTTISNDQRCCFPFKRMTYSDPYWAHGPLRF